MALVVVHAQFMQREDQISPLNKLFLLKTSRGKCNMGQEQVTAVLYICCPEQQAETCETTATSPVYLWLAHRLETDSLCAAPDFGT